MKKNQYVFLILILIACQLQAQDTLRLFSRKPVNKEHRERQHEPLRRNHSSSEIRTIGGRSGSNGFYMGLHTDYSQISGFDAMSMGARLAWISGHHLAIGVAGNGFFTEPQRLNGSSNKDFNYTGGYGGLLIEPILFPRMPIHLSFPVILGAGGIGKGIYYDLYYPYETTDAYLDEADAFLIAEPGVELEINAARWVRLSLGCSYRFTRGIDSQYFSENPLDGLTTGFSLKFGKF
jgi:hypothetical protein